MVDGLIHKHLFRYQRFVKISSKSYLKYPKIVEIKVKIFLVFLTAQTCAPNYYGRITDKIINKNSVNKTKKHT